MTEWEELVKKALIGTQRSSEKISLPVEMKPLSQNQQSAELAMLDAAAAMFAFQRAGIAPIALKAEQADTGRLNLGLSAKAFPDPVHSIALTDQWPECSAKAANALREICEQKDYELLAEWSCLAGKAKKRIPHELLPAFLDRCAERVDLRQNIETIIDQRGSWLARQNKRWQFAESVQGETDINSLKNSWETGSSAERLSAIKAIRTLNPQQATEWIQGTWALDGAEDRAKWLDVFSIELKPADETFLESCLDDRSVRVREAAIEHLARLPESAMIKRLIAIARPCLIFTNDKLTVELPDTYLAEWARDGIREKPTQKIGQKSYWLQQCLENIPPVYWSGEFGCSAEKCIESTDQDYKSLLIDAWRIAAGKSANADWSMALLNFNPGTGKALRSVPDASIDNSWHMPYIDFIPADRRLELLRMISQKKEMQSVFIQLVRRFTDWSAELSQLIVEQLTPGELAGLPNAVLHLHQDAIEAYETKLLAAVNEPYHGGMANRDLDRMRIRKIIIQEFC